MTPEQTERAGYYVLGLMDEGARAAFEIEMASDAPLAQAVSSLEARFHELDETAIPVDRRHELWTKIERQIGAERETVPTAVVTPLRSRRAMLPWYQLAASVIIALCIGYAAGNLGRNTEQPLMIAVLISEDDATPGAIIEAFADDSVRLVPLEAFEVPEGRVLEVWTLPNAETGPVSLGTFSGRSTIHLAGPDLPDPAQGQLYEITLEPAPGSPAGRPTGPILVKGFARAPI
jgi:anti-sigma-K factor RskA